METALVSSALGGSYGDLARHRQRLGTVLGVWAHPDDEAYLSAGLMATARAAGCRVVIVTATRGELGTSDPRRWPPQRLAVRREREMAASMAALGVEEHHWLDHRDGGLDAVGDTAGSAQVGHLLRLVKPDTVVTFGPDGMTGHPDHRAISRWVTAAWQRTKRAKLWYATQTPGFHQEWGALNDRIGLWTDPGAKPSTPERDLAFTVRCTGELLERKQAALRAHWSQTEPLMALVGESTYRKWWTCEYFRAAA